ncbi:hypothetical protein [Amycolatopsis australiensis]|uniref:Uncharacterized protein n=1 Tax=Amycolatopsis australiensis TaxID=546364 RepID=A0A1K1SEG1_9PSEU|nr:hypothetical protein [Amycolatopsis australiensis]SFW82776.1 hypothetical protein SAMN04489730_5498 [Amycolatopsis australiensis]
MRGDWIYDWVRVEMEYRAGPPPVVRRGRADRRAPRHWAALWAGLFPAHKAREA